MLAINVMCAILQGVCGMEAEREAAARAGALADVAAIGGLVALISTFALIFVKGRRINAALLAILIALDVAGAVLFAAAGV